MIMKPPAPPTKDLALEIVEALQDKKKSAALWEPSESRAKTNRLREMIADFVEGTSAVRAKSTTYLFPHKSEVKSLRPRNSELSNVTSGYDRRLRSSVVYPSLSKAIDGVTGKICRRPVKLSDDVSPKVRAVVEKDVDRRGSSLHVFAKRVLRCAAQEGMSLILVDHPSVPVDEKTGKPVSISEVDAERYGIRPFWRMFHGRSVLGTRYDFVNGAPRLCGIRLLEPAPHDGLLGGSGCLERLRIYWLAPAADSNSGAAAFFCVLVREEGKPETTRLETPPSRMYPLEKIPIAAVYCDVDHGDLEASPQFADLCYYNLRDYNKQSDLDDIEYVANVPVPYVTGAEMKSIKREPWGADYLMTLPAGATTGYFEHTGASIGALRSSIAEGREVQRWLALEPMLPKESGGLTATDAAIREAQSVSDLESWAIDLKFALDEALALTALWLSRDYSKPIPSGSVDISATISAIREDSAAIATLSEARKNGDLSRKTYWNELKRRGILDVAFDPTIEEKAIADEEMGGELEVDDPADVVPGAAGSSTKGEDAVDETSSGESSGKPAVAAGAGKKGDAGDGVPTSGVDAGDSEAGS